MRPALTTACWIGGAFVAGAVLAVSALLHYGAGERGTDIGLQLTARFSFLLFWLAYAGRGLVTVFGPSLRPVQQHAREFGLGFAAAHLPHLGLVAWLCWIGATPAWSAFLLFGIAAFWAYLLALLSIGRLQQALGRDRWRLVRLIGMNYIAFAFAVDFFHSPFGGSFRHIATYLPFAALSVCGPLLYATPPALAMARGARASP